MAEITFLNKEKEASALPIPVDNPDVSNPLREFIVDYVGKAIQPDSGTGEVTADMVIKILSVDFPEILLALAEENFVRGYEQGLADIEEFCKTS